MKLINARSIERAVLFDELTLREGKKICMHLLRPHKYIYTHIQAHEYFFLKGSVNLKITLSIKRDLI